MMRSIAGQTVEELGGPGSVLVRRRHDHQELVRRISPPRPHPPSAVIGASRGATEFAGMVEKASFVRRGEIARTHRRPAPGRCPQLSGTASGERKDS